MMAKKKVMDKLAQDAAAALAAGMSYGKWKAMQGTVVIEKIEKIPEGWRACKRCGKPFMVKNFGKRQMYCELACQKAAQRERDKDKIRAHYREYMAKRRAEERKVKNESNT
jgi:hypothetical protein